MRAFLRHFARSLLYLARRPWAWTVVLPAAYASLLMDAPFVWEWLRAARGQTRLALESAALLSVPLALCALVAAILPSAARTPASAGEGWAMPALPISVRARAVAEVGAALTLVLAIRNLYSVAGHLTIFRYWLHGWGGWWSVVWLALRRVTPSGSSIVVSFPLIVAWLGSGRRGSAYWARVLGAHAAVFVGLTVVMLTGSLSAALLPAPLLLSAAIVYSIGREPSWEWTTFRRRCSGALHRAPLEPERRLRADILSRSVPVLGLALVPALVTAPVFAHGIAKPDGDPGKALALLMLGFLGIALTWFAVAIGTLFPLGLPLLISPQELFAGRYRAAWSCLPVRPEAVRRIVFVHAFTVLLLLGTSALLARALVWASTGRAHALLTLAWLPGRHATATWAFLATCWAGLALCIAVGDRARGILAMVGIGLSLWWGDGGERGATAALLIGSLFAALPLVHLRRARRRA